MPNICHDIALRAIKSLEEANALTNNDVFVDFIDAVLDQEMLPPLNTLLNGSENGKWLAAEIIRYFSFEIARRSKNKKGAQILKLLL